MSASGCVLVHVGSPDGGSRRWMDGRYQEASEEGVACRKEDVKGWVRIGCPLTQWIANALVRSEGACAWSAERTKACTLMGVEIGLRSTKRGQ